MTYKSYPSKRLTPSRTARKHMRAAVFLANRKMSKAAHRARKAQREAYEQGE